MHIALFGGRFDPPHIGHLQIARAILSKNQSIDQVWLIPANTHPWRPIVASPSDRLAMTKILKESKITISDIDINRGGETFTIDTVKELLQYPQNTYTWILGSDQIERFSQWRESKKLQHLIPFLVIPRKGYDQVTLPDNFFFLQGDYQATNLSSSVIRDRIQNGQSITGLVPDKVEEYIKEKRLYENF